MLLETVGSTLNSVGRLFQAIGRSRFGLLLRVAFSGALVYLVLSRIDLVETLSILARIEWLWVLGTVVVYSVAELISGRRWQLLLAAQGHDVKLRTLVTWLLIGRIFNQFMPSTIGGDTARFWYSRKSTGTSLNTGAVLMMDRLVGLVALLLVGSLATLFGSSYYPQVAGWRIFALGAFLLAGAVVYVIVRGLPFGLKPIMGTGKITELLTVIKNFRSDRSAVARALWLSLLLQLVVLLRYYTLAKAVGIDIPLLVFAIVVPVAVLFLSVPITLNGLGLREITFIGLFSYWGISAQTSTAFAWLELGFGTLIALLGGVIFLFYRAR